MKKCIGVQYINGMIVIVVQSKRCMEFGTNDSSFKTDIGTLSSSCTPEVRTGTYFYVRGDHDNVLNDLRMLQMSRNAEKTFIKLCKLYNAAYN